MKIIKRKNTGVVQVHFELEYQVYDDLVEYCAAEGMPKRKLIETAVTFWLNARKMEGRREKEDGLV